MSSLGDWQAEHSAKSTMSRRGFLGVVSAAAAAAGAARSVLADPAASSQEASAAEEAIHFPRSFLYCSPTDTGIWVRVQMECRGRLVDRATGREDEYVMGVVAKTGLTKNAATGAIAPGYDYWIIFSRTHVFTRRTHASVYLNNPTTLTHDQFGLARWRCDRVRARRLVSPSDVRHAVESWQLITARTEFPSRDGSRSFIVEYPVKWADFGLESESFRVETGPVFLLDPDKLEVGVPPAFEDFQWAHLDYHDFAGVRCLLDKPTWILDGAAFFPPTEHNRQFRQTPAISPADVAAMEKLLFTEGNLPISAEAARLLFQTDHYSQAKDVPATTQLFALELA